MISNRVQIFFCSIQRKPYINLEARRMYFAKVFLLPPASLFLLYFLGKTLRGRFRPFGQILAAGSLVIFFVFCTGWGARLLVAPLENLTRPVTKDSIGSAEAIVLLSAGRFNHAREYDGRDIPDYIALARMRYAARLHRQSGLPILVSGGLGTDNQNTEPLASLVAQSLKDDFSIPVKWQETNSRNTRENAKYSAAILQAAGIKKILLVTDAMHMRRASLAFESTNLQITEAPTIFLGNTELGIYALIPSAESLRRSYYATYQWLGIIQHELWETVRPSQP